MNTNLRDAAQKLHHFAEWTDTHASWIEPGTRHPNDDADPAMRTVTLNAVLLDDFLNGLRRLGPALEQLAKDIELPKLWLVNGGRS